MKKSIKRIFQLTFVCLFISNMLNAQDYTTGLVAHYEFENSNGYIVDAAGLHTGIIVGNVTRDQQGMIGKAFNFNGGYVSITDHSDITNYSEFTLAAWVNPSYLGTHNSIISKVTPNRDFNLKIYASQLEESHFAYNATYYSVVNTTTISTGQWVHVVSTWKNNEWKIYYNGILEKTQPYPGIEPPWTGTIMDIGAMSNGEVFHGLIDEVRVYNRALTETDVLALYNYRGTQLPNLTINDPTIDENATSVKFTINLDTIATQDITGNYTTINGTALYGEDYTMQSGTFTINAQDSSTTVTISIEDDSLEELDETFKIVISDVVGAVVIKDTGYCTILANDFANVSINDSVFFEEDGQAIFTISLDKTSFQDISGNYTTLDNTALNGSDYTLQNGSFVINAGVLDTSISIPLLDDSIEEVEESFKLVLSNVNNATLAKDTGLCIIPPNDLAVLSIGETTVLEEDGQALFSITLDKASIQNVSFDYNTKDLTATAGSDYSAQTGSISLPAGITDTVISIPLIDDLDEEAEESFAVVLETPVNVIFSKDTGVCFIQTNDLASLSVNDTVVTETDGQVSFIIKLNKPSQFLITGNYYTSDITATDSLDYTSQSGTFVLNPGEDTVVVNIPIIDDEIEDNGETFKLSIDSVLNATITDTSGICTIVDGNCSVTSVNDTIGDVQLDLFIDGSELSITGGNTVTLPTGSSNITEIITGEGLIGGGTNGVITIEANVEAPIWNANKLQGKFINSTDPDDGMVLKWDESTQSWGPAVDETGDAGTTFWRLTNSGTNIFADIDGNVGIGTGNEEPDEKLTVNGNIHAEEVIVDLSVPGPDYVFEREYELKTLDELEIFLDKCKHLPEIPSANDMEINGISLSEMNMMLLKKIEELTLYIIDQEKRINQLENQPKKK